MVHYKSPLSLGYCMFGSEYDLKYSPEQKGFQPKIIHMVVDYKYRVDSVSMSSNRVVFILHLQIADAAACVFRQFIMTKMSLLSMALFSTKW